ncbi:MAG: hypothetical protein K0R08_1510 [Solimicrobium sp.]|jgi:hypothetical protein|nr:hypothetical protein [Solimicrobium sp.]
MQKLLTTLTAVSVALTFSIAAYSANDEARANYNVAKENANATYKAARAKCDTLSGNPKDVCIEEAKAEEKRTVANAEARYQNTPAASMKARIAIADADFAVAKEKCKAQTGQPRDLCIKKARADHTRAKVDAKSHKEISDINSDAAQEKRDAAYKVELEKCNSLGGAAKDACIATAKSNHNK